MAAQKEPALQNIIDTAVERVNAHTVKVVDSAFNELAAMTNKQFGILENRLDGIDGRLDGIDGRLDGIDGRLDQVDEKLGDVRDHLILIDNRIGIRPKFEFTEG